MLESLGSISKLKTCPRVFFVQVIPPFSDRKTPAEVEVIKTLLLLRETANRFGATHVEPSVVVVGNGAHEFPPSVVRQTRYVSVYSIDGLAKSIISRVKKGAVSPD